MAYPYWKGAQETAASWFKYPALPIAPATGGAVKFVDASGEHLLESINSNLFFNGNLLAQAGNVPLLSNWATLPAVTNVDMNNNDLYNANSVQIKTGLLGTANLTTNVGGDVLNNGFVLATQAYADTAVTQWSNSPAISVVDLSFNNIAQANQIQGKQLAITGDNAADLTGPGRVNITGQNGLQGQVNVVANPGAFGQSVGGAVNITANGGVLGPVTFGGAINIDANTGAIGSYGAATSAIKMSAAGINSYAGAIPSIASLAGYNFIYGTGGVNICAGLPPLLPNIPLTTYVYGTGGVGLEAGIGAEVEVKNSTLATLSLQPRTSVLVNFGDLAITGRNNVVQPDQYVTLDMVKSITFDPATAASISNVATINGAAYPPPADLPTQWAVYPAVQNVDVSGFSVTNALNVTGTGSVTGGTLTTTAGNLQIFDPAPPGTFYGDVKYDSGLGRLAVLPQGTGAEAVAYLSDIPQVYVAQYSKSLVQNLTSGNTDITFNLDASWNSVGGYITHTPGSASFTVVQPGVYQLEFNAFILSNGAVLSPTTNRAVRIDITRGARFTQFIQNTFTVGGQNYAIQTGGTTYLEVGDIITCQVGLTFTGGPAQANPSAPPDPNTFFTWTFVK